MNGAFFLYSSVSAQYSSVWQVVPQNKPQWSTTKSHM